MQILIKPNFTALRALSYFTILNNMVFFIIYCYYVIHLGLWNQIINTHICLAFNYSK